MIDMINNVAFHVHGGGMGEGLAGGLLSVLEFIEGLSGKTPPEMFATIMPGIAALDNIHPLFVHYPIALFTVFFIFELLGVLFNKAQWRYVASWLLYLGTIFASLTVAAGLFAAETVEHGEDVHDIMERHEHIGIAVLSLALFLSAWRLKQWGIHSSGANAVFLILAGILCLLLSLGADLGGLMVYRYGVSVKPSAVIDNSADKTEGAVSVSPGSSNTGDDRGHHDHGGHGHSHSHEGHHHHSH